MSIVENLSERKVTDLVPGFDETAFMRVQAQGEPSLLAAKREEAFNLYAGIPMPTVRDEEWRRTDPASFPFEQLRRLPDAKPADTMRPGAWDDSFDVVVTVKDSAFAIRDVSGAGGRAVVLSMQEAAQRYPEFMAEHLQGAAGSAHPRKFELLADAFWNVGFLIHVPKDTKLERGILLRYEHTAANSVIIPRLLVVVDSGSEVEIVEHFTSPDGVTQACVGSREFYAAAQARLKLVTLQEWGSETRHISEDWARVGRDGTIDWITLTLGGKASKMMVGSDVCEPNAKAYLSGLFFAEGEQRFDQRTLQLHSAPNTYSNLLYKGAVKDRGYSVYQGVINAKPGAIHVDAYQMNNNLILNEGARADSLPGLEIDADDLKCSHGATMGSLDEEQIYYLRSRGLNELDAKRLIVTGFFEEIVSKVPYDFIQERLREHIERKMRSAG